MKAWRKENFSNFAKKISGTDGTVILVPSKNNDAYRVASKVEILENFYHAISIENDCSSTKHLSWLVEKIAAMRSFDELSILVDEEINSRNGCEGTPIIAFIEHSENGVLEYLRYYEYGNEKLTIDDFLCMDEEEYGIAYNEIAKTLLALLPLKVQEQGAQK